MSVSEFKIKNNNNQELACWLHKANNNNTLIITCHGHPSNSHHRHKLIAEFLKEHDHNTLRFDFRGCGNSEGLFEECMVSTATNDLKAVIAWAKENNYEEITVMGSSFGGAVAIKAALTEDIKELILLSPAPDMSETQEYYEFTTMKEWKEKGYFMRPNNKHPDKPFKILYKYYEDCLANIIYEPSKNIKVRTLIIHGTADESVPLEQAQKLAENIPEALLIILEGADHKLMINNSLDDMKKILLEWLTNKN